MTQPAVLPDVVHITLPDGAPATVPKGDAAQALAAGAHLQTDAEASPLGGLGGMGLTALFGAGRAATLGASDLIASEAAGLVGGEGWRKDALHGMGALKEANPYSDMAGQFGGLVLGGVGAAGAKVETMAAGRVGEGLLGSMAGMGARGAVEGAAIGAQQRFSEDVLGDHELNGQAIFSSAVKDGLIGAGGGAALGAAGHFFGGAANRLLKGSRGPTSDAVLDEVAGAEGAGRAAQAEARSTEGLIDNLRQAGATSEQAADAAATAQSAAETTAEQPGFLARAYKGARRALGGMDDSLEGAMDRGYAERLGRIVDHDEALNIGSRAMAKDGTEAFRKSEDTFNKIHFTERGDQMAKLVDPTKYSAARDAAVSMGQDVRASLSELNSLPTKGDSAHGLVKLEKHLQEFEAKIAKLPTTEGSAAETRDLFMANYKLKQAVQKRAGMGKAPYLRTEAESEFFDVSERLRLGLENEGVWGGAGGATKELNESFSTGFGRRQDFGNRFATNVDSVAGTITPEMDAGKVKGMLSQLGGAESDQAVKTTEAYIDWVRARDAAIRKHGDITPAQRVALDEGREAVNRFEKTFRTAQKESEAIAVLKRQQDKEHGKGIGGLLGIIGDAASKPLTTMERLAGVRHTTESVTGGISKGLQKAFGSAKAEATAAAPLRTKEVMTKEIGDIRELAGNPGALEGHVAKMVGDLSDHAPQTADEVKATAKRAIYYLAKEAPMGGIALGLLGTHKSEPRYSDTQLSSWEAKRNAVLGADGKTGPEVLIADMHTGKLNREGIKAIEFVSPKLFEHMQGVARDELERMEQCGLLDKMPYQQKAAIASLLKIPADGTWRPDFMALIQASKAPLPPPMAAPAPPGAPTPMQTFGRKADKPTAHMWMTEAATIEGGGLI